MQQTHHWTGYLWPLLARCSIQPFPPVAVRIIIIIIILHDCFVKEEEE